MKHRTTFINLMMFARAHRSYRNRCSAYWEKRLRAGMIDQFINWSSHGQHTSLSCGYRSWPADADAPGAFDASFALQRSGHLIRQGNACKKGGTMWHSKRWPCLPRCPNARAGARVGDDSKVPDKLIRREDVRSHDDD
jgi:hypothetical protein